MFHLLTAAYGLHCPVSIAELRHAVEANAVGWDSKNHNRDLMLLADIEASQRHE